LENEFGRETAILRKIEESLEVFRKNKHNQTRSLQSNLLRRGEKPMNGLSGMEKFSHLEDKIYLTIEFAKKMREEKEKIEREMKSLRHEVSNLLAEKSRLEEKVEDLLSERDAIQLKSRSDARRDDDSRTDVAEAVTGKHFYDKRQNKSEGWRNQSASKFTIKLTTFARTATTNILCVWPNTLTAKCAKFLRAR
jgi:FtsZ-binding cell division protein ZapB